NKSFNVSTIRTLAIQHKTNNEVPTGGVNKPIANVHNIMIEKCIGSTPISAVIGYKIGTKINKFGTVSKNIPPNVIIKIITNINPQLGKPNPNKISEINLGTPSFINTQEKIILEQTMNITTVDVYTVSINALAICLKLSERYTKTEITNAYTAANAAASVALAIPNAILKTRKIGKINVNDADKKLRPISFNEA